MSHEATWPDDYDDCPVCGGLTVNCLTDSCDNGCF